VEIRRSTCPVPSSHPPPGRARSRTPCAVELLGLDPVRRETGCVGFWRVSSARTVARGSYPRPRHPPPASGSLVSGTRARSLGCAVNWIPSPHFSPPREHSRASAVGYEEATESIRGGLEERALEDEDA
jgi:hypothetical protein